jgi:hypothetical protein
LIAIAGCERRISLNLFGAASKQKQQQQQQQQQQQEHTTSKQAINLH